MASALPNAADPYSNSLARLVLDFVATVGALYVVLVLDFVATVGALYVVLVLHFVATVGALYVVLRSRVSGHGDKKPLGHWAAGTPNTKMLAGLLCGLEYS